MATTQFPPTLQEHEQSLTFPEFMYKSFDYLFQQNLTLHQSLHEFLQESSIKKIDVLTARIEELENNLKNAFLFYTQNIMQGLNEANTELIQKLQPQDTKEI